MDFLLEWSSSPKSRCGYGVFKIITFTMRLNGPSIFISKDYPGRIRRLNNASPELGRDINGAFIGLEPKLDFVPEVSVRVWRV